MKSTKKRTSRCKRCKRCKTNRRHKHVKGGMRRAATQTAKTVFEGVFGKGPDRVEKMYEMGKAAFEGATKETAKKGAEMVRSSRHSFEDILPTSSPFHISHVKNPMTSRMSSHGHDSDENETPNYNTPKKPTPTTEPPKLPQRQRQSTPKTRVLRLSSTVAPTVDQPTPLATRLSFDDDYE